MVKCQIESHVKLLNDSILCKKRREWLIEKYQQHSPLPHGASTKRQDHQ
jgi:hypothetical protein